MVAAALRNQRLPRRLHRPLLPTKHQPQRPLPPTEPQPQRLLPPNERNDPLRMVFRQGRGSVESRPFFRLPHMIKIRQPSPFVPSLFFPDARTADDNGLVALGGDMTPVVLYDAYVHGIFPWPFSGAGLGPPNRLGWFSPNPRGVFEFETFHIPKRLARLCRSGRFRITSNRNFRGVLLGCALTPYRDGISWVTPSLYQAYLRLYSLGFAHSVEAWLDDRLVGGVYGVAINGFFAAESMFRIETNASNVALVALTEHLKACGYRLFDIQMITPHTARFGAVDISRDEYLQRLHDALQIPTIFDDKR